VRTRSGDGTRGARVAKLRRELGIAAGLARRDLHQRIPYPLLERGAEQVDRHPRALAGKRIGDRAHARSEELVAPCIDALAQRRRELGNEPRLQHRVVVAQLDHADAALGGSDQRAAECGIDQAPANRHVLAAGAVARRRHAQFRCAVFVDARRRAVAGVVQRRADVLAIAQRRLQLTELALRQVCRRTDSETRAESALQVRCADADRAGEFGERGFAGIQQLPGAFDGIVCVCHGGKD
jgi:hypothetical protein